MRVNVWIPDDLLKKLDKTLETVKDSRSSYISKLIKVSVGDVTDNIPQPKEHIGYTPPSIGHVTTPLTNKHFSKILNKWM